MGKSGFRAGVWTAALALALTAGVAWAMETQSRAVPTGASYQVVAVLVPGSGGAEVCGEKDTDQVDFSVGFGAGGNLVVNGETGGAYDPNASYKVTVDVVKVAGIWYASTTVRNQGTGTVEFTQAMYVMPGAADQVHATAADVISLNVN